MIEQLDREAPIYASNYRETGAIDGLHVDCLGMPGSRRAGGEARLRSAACAEISGNLDTAISAYEKVRTDDPSRDDVRFAIAHLGVLYARRGTLDLAAVRLEEYAARYAGEKDAKDALASAAAYRAARGEDRKRREDEQSFLRDFARSARTESVAAFLRDWRLRRCHRGAL